MKKINLKDLADWLSSFKDNIKVVTGILIILFLLDTAILLRLQLLPLMRLFSKAGQLKADIKQARDDIKFFSTYKNKLVDLRAQLLGFEKKVILEEGLPNMLEQISKYADTSGVKILKMKPSIGKQKTIKIFGLQSVSGATEPEFYRQSVSLTVNAGFHQLGCFSALLESSKIFFGIQGLEIQGNEQEPERQMITLVLELIVKKA